MKDDDADLPPADLELRQTRLRVEDGELVRRHAEGGVVTRVPLDDIESIRFVRRYNAFGFAGVGMAGGVAAIGYFISQYNVVTVLLYVAAMFLAVFALFGVWNDVIEVRARGETLNIQCPDAADEVAGFVASVKPLVGGPRGRE